MGHVLTGFLSALGGGLAALLVASGTDMFGSLGNSAAQSVGQSWIKPGTLIYVRSNESCPDDWDPLGNVLVIGDNGGTSNAKEYLDRQPGENGDEFRYYYGKGTSEGWVEFRAVACIKDR